METKKSKTEKCRQILHGIKVGKKIENKDDFLFLIQLFENHTEWEAKKGAGIEFITVECTIYKNKCFVLHRVDGTTTDISFTHCINNKSNILQIKEACRSAIKEITKEVRKKVNYGIDRCIFTDEILTTENVHIDHYDLTFGELFNIWIKDKNQNELFEKINKTTDNETETFFTDENIVNDFIVFHNNNTHLRAVSKTANLKILTNQKINNMENNMFIQIKTIEQIPDKFGSFIGIKKIGLYDNNGKWIRWVKLNENLIELLKNQKIKI